MEKVRRLIEMLRLAAALRVNLFVKAAEGQLRHIKEFRSIVQLVTFHLGSRSQTEARG